MRADIAQDITTDPPQPLVKYFVNFTGQRVSISCSSTACRPAIAARFSPRGDPGGLRPAHRERAEGHACSKQLCATLVEYLIVKIAELLVPGEAAQTPAFATTSAAASTSRRSTPA